MPSASPSSSYTYHPVAEHTPIADHEFERCARLLHDRAGIVIGAHRREVLERIVHAHLLALGLHSVRDYLSHLQSDAHSPEWECLINAVTINHTAFFRERHHFDLLTQFVRNRTKPVSVWCCAASTGEEPYSIAMTLAEAGHIGEANILATDIDTEALQKAKVGVYTCAQIEPVSALYRKKYLQRGVGEHDGQVRVKPVLRNMIKFQALNLMDTHWSLPEGQKFDAIFCRNTMIYFDTATQKRILEHFVPALKPDGLLFVGHSENFTRITTAFCLRGQTVYTRTNAR